jgi:hypothetical protein
MSVVNLAVQVFVSVVIAAIFPGAASGQAAESETGSVCIAPVFEKPDGMSAPGLFCESAKLSLKIDTQQAVPFPLISEQHGTYQVGKSLKTDGMDTSTRHRVVVYCNGKPQQSFTFRFSDFKTSQLCLFLNDLYKTAQFMGGEAVSLVQVQMRLRTARGRFDALPKAFWKRR